MALLHYKVVRNGTVTFATDNKVIADFRVLRYGGEVRPANWLFRERRLEVKWTQRNVDRVFRWLRLTADFSGMLYIDGVCVGYKQAGRDNHTLIFIFNPL